MFSRPISLVDSAAERVLLAVAGIYYNKKVALPIAYIGFVFCRPSSLVGAAAERSFLAVTRVLAVHADECDARFFSGRVPPAGVRLHSARDRQRRHRLPELKQIA